jgi:hypothetical protein
MEALLARLVLVVEAWVTWESQEEWSGQLDVENVEVWGLWWITGVNGFFFWVWGIFVGF